MTEQPVWRPLSVRSSMETVDIEEPAEGIPEWLTGSLEQWVRGQSTRGGEDQRLRAERLLRRELPEVALHRYWHDAWEDEERLDIIDFLLKDLFDLVQNLVRRGDAQTASIYASGAEGLDLLLREGGSIWRVVQQPVWGLERRVTEAATDQVAAVVSQGTHAAREISRAWHACYKHHPEPSAAYTHAVFAVEAVVLPLTIPNDRAGTLGKAIAHLRDTRRKWTVAHLDTDQQASIDTLLSMLATLWTNQARHAASDGTIRGVPQAEAEAAISLAVTLVQWFTSGLVQRLVP